MYRPINVRVTSCRTKYRQFIDFGFFFLSICEVQSMHENYWLRVKSHSADVHYPYTSIWYKVYIDWDDILKLAFVTRSSFVFGIRLTPRDHVYVSLYPLNTHIKPIQIHLLFFRVENQRARVGVSIRKVFWFTLWEIELLERWMREKNKYPAVMLGAVRIHW